MIKPLATATSHSGCNAELGGFAGLFDLKATGFVYPILIAGTDGEGTKLKIAQACNIHNTLGQDLVAMCVNDVLAQGAEPLFLDYFSCGQLDVGVASSVIHRIAEACQMAGCAFLDYKVALRFTGIPNSVYSCLTSSRLRIHHNSDQHEVFTESGETAEMPGVYGAGEYDLAGFCVGAVELDSLLPRLGDIQEGDILIEVASSGVHSNGFSLVRKILERARLQYSSPASFGQPGQTVGKLLNMHPSLLPSFKCVNAQKQALLAGVQIAGCTVHFVAEEVDAGAIIIQEAVPILTNDTKDGLSEHIREAAHQAFPTALELVASGTVRLGEDRHIIWNQSA